MRCLPLFWRRRAGSQRIQGGRWGGLEHRDLRARSHSVDASREHSARITYAEQEYSAGTIGRREICPNYLDITHGLPGRLRNTCGTAVFDMGNRVGDCLRGAHESSHWERAGRVFFPQSDRAVVGGRIIQLVAESATRRHHFKVLLIRSTVSVLYLIEQGAHRA